MHVTHTARNRIARTEVISHSTAQHESEREVLSLRKPHPFGSLSVNKPEAKSSFKVGRNFPVTLDKVTSNTHDVSPVPCFRSPRNHSVGPAEREIPIAA